MSLESQLTGGHPNSLGNTVEVVDAVLADPDKLEELFHCYWSQDETVRLRVSNAMKRIEKAEHDWLLPYLDRFLTDVALIDQASTKWTLSQLFLAYEKDLSPGQRRKAITVMRENLTSCDDWIVQSQTMNTLGRWAKKDAELRRWLLPVLEDRTTDPRKSISGRAAKILATLSA